ncbi:MAG TPA: aminotransferase class I/II-fold pyridoxal phosphate-dependent enzyme [Thermoanaerobaculia bacterium]|nr:aminotransferase class I/II-fold pyridoxal phosphate-dependent enzyme [Thermoanaerobaculia bacterium]
MDRYVLDPSAERLDGPGILDLAYPVVQDWPTPEPVLEALREAAGLVARYPHREREVREALAAYLGREPGEIVPTVGGNGALDLVSRAWLSGRRVMVPFPAFWQLVDAPLRYGATLSNPSLLEAGAYERMVAEFAVAGELEAIVLCSPNNPLGQPLDSGFLDRLLEVSDGRPVIVDESYADLDGLCAARGELHPDLVLVRGFKTFLIPGVRAGYVVASAARVRQLSQVRPPFEGNVFSEAAILAVLREIDALREVWRQVRSDLRYLEAGLAALGGEVVPSQALFACWRHPQALPIARALASLRIYVISSERPVIHGMPADMLRLTARRRDVADTVLFVIRKLLERLASLPQGLSA